MVLSRTDKELIKKYEKCNCKPCQKKFKKLVMVNAYKEVFGNNDYWTTLKFNLNDILDSFIASKPLSASTDKQIKFFKYDV